MKSTNIKNAFLANPVLFKPMADLDWNTRAYNFLCKVREQNKAFYADKPMLLWHVFLPETIGTKIPGVSTKTRENVFTTIKKLGLPWQPFTLKDLGISPDDSYEEQNKKVAAFFEVDLRADAKISETSAAPPEDKTPPNNLPEADAHTANKDGHILSAPIFDSDLIDDVKEKLYGNTRLFLSPYWQNDAAWKYIAMGSRPSRMRHDTWDEIKKNLKSYGFEPGMFDAEGINLDKSLGSKEQDIYVARFFGIDEKIGKNHYKRRDYLIKKYGPGSGYQPPSYQEAVHLRNEKEAAKPAIDLQIYLTNEFSAALVKTFPDLKQAIDEHLQAIPVSIKEAANNYLKGTHISGDPAPVAPDNYETPHILNIALDNAFNQAALANITGLKAELEHKYSGEINTLIQKWAEGQVFKTAVATTLPENSP